MLKVKVPAIYLILSIVVGFSILFFAFKRVPKNDSTVTVGSEIVDKEEPCTHNSLRLNGFTYIKPLMGAEKECESIARYGSLKSELTAFIENEKSKGTLADASVYLEDCTNDDWMGINFGAVYMPGSLLKVPTLITILKMAEATPGLLDKEILFDSKLFPPSPKQTFDSIAIQSGHKYKIRELLHSMVAYSDNYSTWLLNSKMNGEIYKKVYAELGLPAPENYNNYKVSAKSYSMLLKVLYNVGYLTIPNSEYAMSLMSECDFKAGMVKKLPSTVKVAHKYGEAGTPEFSELHESGIVYIDKNPYLLTVMTKGKDVRKQADVISDISKMVYDQMIAMKGR